MVPCWLLFVGGLGLVFTWVACVCMAVICSSIWHRFFYSGMPARPDTPPMAHTGAHAPVHAQFHAHLCTRGPQAHAISAHDCALPRA
eukprot:2323372-Alexandrium_andersonii.AAC.1